MNSINNPNLDDSKGVCHYCEEVKNEDELDFLNNGHDLICSDCLESKYTKCRDCGKYFENDDIHYLMEDDAICDDCLAEIGFIACTVCGDIYIMKEDIIENPYICERCSKNEKETVTD